ncbi:TerB family tellurite resistance protein [Amorphus orientalis]|uniref:Tellurite resistance protein B-like protein n=1 Tax=Amorphus orientalis TaxID=649198 RepID=A0AAE3VSR8_9HYPH|nr:TerB family tellurite resistance protein [Amorphus orientalis]MDQ0316926.1 putative tellurite resistance protein B-like protein [Amorphus orientalis]
MFKAIREWLQIEGLGEEEERQFGPDDHRVAVAALLVHLVAIDGVITDDERRVLREVLADHYDLAPDDTEELVKLAKQRDDEAVDLYGFTSVLKRVLDEDGRKQVVEMMWEMGFADGRISEFEDNTVWRVAELLGVTSRERIEIKKRVEARLERGSD